MPDEPTGSGHERSNLTGCVRNSSRDKSHHNVRQQGPSRPRRCNCLPGAEKEACALLNALKRDQCLSSRNDRDVNV